MSLIIWDERYSVKIEQIDMQHRQLIQMINELDDAIAMRKTNQVLGKIIDTLIHYSVFHFKTEEQLFEQYAYSDSTAHRNEHASFEVKVREFKKDFMAGKLMLCTELVAYLKEWLINHILDSDQKYGAFLREKGVQ